MSFSQILQMLMKNNTISAYKLSQLLEVSQSTIKNWIDGKTSPIDQNLYKLAQIFHVSECYLLTGENASFTEEEVELIAAYQNLTKQEQQIILGKIAEMNYNRDHTSDYVTVYKAANSVGNKEPAGYVTITREQLKKLKEAPDTDLDV